MVTKRAMVVLALVAGVSLPAFAAGPGRRGKGQTPKLDDVLKQWHAAGAALKTLEVDFTLVSVEDGKKDQSVGRMCYQAPNKVRIEFGGENPATYVLTDGGECWWYRTPFRQIYVFDMTLEKVAQRGGQAWYWEMYMTLMRHPDEVKKHFDFKVEEDSATMTVVSARSKNSNDQAMFWIDKTSKLPVKIHYRDSQYEAMYQFKPAQTNVALKESEFAREKLTGWHLLRASDSMVR